MIKVLLFAGLLLLQSPESDPENAPPEPGKPLQCDNHLQTPEAHRCHCARDRQKCEGMPQPPVPVAMDQSCLTYCRQQRCECRGNGCRS